MVIAAVDDRDVERLKRVLHQAQFSRAEFAEACRLLRQNLERARKLQQRRVREALHLAPVLHQPPGLLQATSFFFIIFLFFFFLFLFIFLFFSLFFLFVFFFVSE